MGMVIDPVCGMRIDPDDAVATAERLVSNGDDGGGEEQGT